MTKIANLAPQERLLDGLRIRFAETDAIDEPVVLLLNPWPESLYAWESLWSRFAAKARLVAVDLPGFGGSEGREDLYSPQAMGRFLVDLIRKWELGRPHVVGPDVGTGAALFAAATDPTAITSAIVGSGATSVPLRVEGNLKELIEAPDLAAIAAVDGRDVVADAMALFEFYEPSAAAREDYLASYAGGRFAESARYVRAYPTDMPRLAELLPGIEVPVQVIAGARDPMVPPANAYFLGANLPHCRVDLVDAGHFAWEDRASEWGDIALAWIGGGYKKGAL
jgi:pimeloyl-ACP methyl ester carboxylesterase